MRTKRDKGKKGQIGERGGRRMEEMKVKIGGRGVREISADKERGH